MYPVPFGKPVIVVTAVYDERTDDRLFIERLLWRMVRFDTEHQARKEALLLLARLYEADPQAAAVH